MYIPWSNERSSVASVLKLICPPLSVIVTRPQFSTNRGRGRGTKTYIRGCATISRGKLPALLFGGLANYPPGLCASLGGGAIATPLWFDSWVSFSCVSGAFWVPWAARFGARFGTKGPKWEAPT